MAAHDVDSEDPSLSTIESLVLAQAVYEHGADAWQSVSKVLSKHPALARPEESFSPQVSLVHTNRAMYSLLSVLSSPAIKSTSVS